MKKLKLRNLYFIEIDKDMSKTTHFVMPTCSASFLKKDCGQAAMTEQR